MTIKLRMYRLFQICVVLFVTSFLTSTAYAQKKSGKRQTIDFEDELIEGEVKKPELFYLLQKKQFNFRRLIKLRNNFLPEMERTSEELRHIGRKD